MPQSLSRILVHIVFSTKDRKPFLKDKRVRGELHGYLHGVLERLACPSLEINSVDDHIHILCVLSRKIAVMKLVEEIKTSTSKWIKTKGDLFRGFQWQGGYGAFSIGQSLVVPTRRYISNQKEHHRKKSFQEEFRGFLDRYEIKYDERYIWD